MKRNALWRLVRKGLHGLDPSKKAFVAGSSLRSHTSWAVIKKRDNLCHRLLPTSIIQHNSESCHFRRLKQFSTHQSDSAAAGGIIEVPLAQTGEGIAECELLQWFVKEGDHVDEFAPLCEVQSDKATLQITSRYKGKIARVNFLPGDVIKVGETLVEILTGDNDNEKKIETSSESRSSDAELSEGLETQNFQVGNTKKVLATPAVRHLAQQYGINLQDVSGTGTDGRILKEDLLVYAANKEGLNEEITAITQISPKPSGIPSISESEKVFDSSKKAAEDFHMAPPKMSEATPKDQIIHVRGYQRTMVKTMTSAAQIPHFYLMEEINVDALVELKKILYDTCLDLGVKLTYLPFILKSLSVSLSKYPLVNSTCNGDTSEICCRGAHNIGVAMATLNGLVVPNVKNVQQLSVLEIARKLSELSALAASNKLSSEDVSGGTITVSNIGAIGGKFGCPLLNIPEVAIVGIGRIQKLPRFTDDGGDVYPASIMNVTWGADHRVLDGATLTKFCNEWKTLLEKPERLIMYLK